MRQRRRAALALVLAAVLGTLAFQDVARREAALDARLAPLVPVLVARRDLPRGRPLTLAVLVVRLIPARYAPIDALAQGAAAAGLRPAGDLPAGAYVTAGALELADTDARDEPGRLRAGERALQVVASAAPGAVGPGTRVDILVARESRPGARGVASIALEDIEVLAVGATGAPDGPGEPERVAVTLRVTPRQAVFLAAAQSYARELRLLPRAAGDRRRGAAGFEVDERLR